MHLLSLAALSTLLALLELRNYVRYSAQAFQLSWAKGRMKTLDNTGSSHAEKSPTAVHFSNAEFPIQRIASHKLNSGHARTLGFAVIVNKKMIPNVHGIKRETGSDDVFDGIRRLFNNIHRVPSVGNVLAFESTGVHFSLVSPN